MSDIDKILRILDPQTLPQDMRGMGFQYKILPTRKNFIGKDLRGCVFYKCHPKLDNEDCLQIDAIADISKYNKALDLETANLDGADLEGVSLQGVNLKGASLQGTYLKGANLEGANLRGANLEDADLQDANLVGANFLGANLEGARLVDAIYDDESRQYLYENQLRVMRHISEVDDDSEEDDE